MLETVGVVEIPGGCEGTRPAAARRVGGKSLLEWVVRRVGDCQQLSGVVALTESGPNADEIAHLVPTDVPLFVASGGDSLSRFAETLKQYPARAVVRVGLENPFIDPALIDRLVTTAKTHAESDCITYCSRTERSVLGARVGAFAEYIRARALRLADIKAEGADRATVTRFIYAHPELFNLRLAPIPVELDRDDIRLRLETPEDWEHMQSIFEALGPDRLEWQNIAGLLDQHPHLRERMAELNHARG